MMSGPDGRCPGKCAKPRAVHATASLALSKHAGPGAGMRQLRVAILEFLAGDHETICAECVAAKLGQPVSVIIMSILGLGSRLNSFHGVCSVCRRRPEPGPT